jgi:hypothetical protein
MSYSAQTKITVPQHSSKPYKEERLTNEAMQNNHKKHMPPSYVMPKNHGSNSFPTTKTFSAYICYEMTFIGKCAQPRKSAVHIKIPTTYTILAMQLSQLTLYCKTRKAEGENGLCSVLYKLLSSVYVFLRCPHTV